MARSDDDDDAYLYGSEDESAQPATKKRKTVSTTEPESTKQEEVNEEEEDEDDDEEEEDSSDDDIDIVIGDSVSKVATTAKTDAESGEAEKDSNTTTIVSNNQAREPLDINKVAELDGKPLTAVDLENLKDKPWRIPGADISDYFNYGFDEFTWTAYCHKQDKTRGEFNPQKLMAKLMGSAPPMPPMGMNMGMMPPMPQMPPMGMMGGMPPMPPNFKPGPNGFQMPPPPPPPPKK